MTRHGRNCTAGTVYTYHERQKDTSISGYGSQKLRLGKDSVKDFDCCCLTLQPCKDPVVTPWGYLFDKEAILEYILHQKRDIARQLKEYEKQKNKKEAELKELAMAEQEKRRHHFFKSENNPISHGVESKSSIQDATASVSNMVSGRDKLMPSFWIPSLTPKASSTLVKKPDEKVRCPMTGQALRFKDLTGVKFTPIGDRDNTTALISKTARFVCAVTNDVLSNTIPCAVLRSSGNVVTMECVEMLIMKDMTDPTNGKKVTEKDIIPLQRGGTGFAGTGVQLEAQKAGPSLMA